MVNGALVIELINNTFSESKKNFWPFDEALIKTNVLIEKNTRFRLISKLFRGANLQES